MTESQFSPDVLGVALYLPPRNHRLLLRMAPKLERFGSGMAMGVGGVIIVEAHKEVMAPITGNVKVVPAQSKLSPVDTTRPAGLRRR
jgi:hypothetical protein